MHDPTTKNRQGPDSGSQYRSAIFYHDPEQEKVARSVTEKVNREWWRGGVVTEIIRMFFFPFPSNFSSFGVLGIYFSLVVFILPLLVICCCIFVGSIDDRSRIGPSKVQ